MNYFAIPGIITLKVGVKNITISNIAAIVADRTNISVSDMRSKSRLSEVVQARQITMLLCKKYTDLTLKSIAVFFGGRDHTTAIHSVNHIRNLISVEKKLANTVENIEIGIRSYLER